MKDNETEIEKLIEDVGNIDNVTQVKTLQYFLEKREKELKEKEAESFDELFVRLQDKYKKETCLKFNASQSTNIYTDDSPTYFFTNTADTGRTTFIKIKDVVIKNYQDIVLQFDFAQSVKSSSIHEDNNYEIFWLEFIYGSGEFCVAEGSKELDFKYEQITLNEYENTLNNIKRKYNEY